MKLENSFEVKASPDRAWDLLMDVPRIVPCMPGAELVDTLDGDHWKAKMAVKLGPISLTFDTDVTREESDEQARRATLAASARETRGKGSARATIESTLSELEDGTRVDIVTELALSGPVAVYGRGLIADVSGELVNSFAKCLQAQLEASPEEARAAVAAQAKPVSGFSVGLRALLRRLGRIFGRR
jgi:carbon monoxide dehydrogenase subunit G